MKSDRPVNLDIFTMNLPFAAWASIAHRITGGILFVGLVFGLYALQLALSSAQGFAEAVTLSDTVLGRIIFTGLVFSFSYHLLAGIKHLLLDFHIGDSVRGAHLTSVVVVLLALLATLVFGVLIW